MDNTTVQGSPGSSNENWSHVPLERREKGVISEIQYLHNIFTNHLPLTNTEMVDEFFGHLLQMVKDGKRIIRQDTVPELKPSRPKGRRKPLPVGAPITHQESKEQTVCDASEPVTISHHSLDKKRHINLDPFADD